MILQLLLATIAATAPVPVARPAPIVVVPQGAVRQLACRAEFGTASLVQRVRVCRTPADWRRLDARRRGA